MRTKPVLRFRRRSAVDRAIALLLTWAIPGSSAWALTPALAAVAPRVVGAAPSPSTAPDEAEASAAGLLPPEGPSASASEPALSPEENDDDDTVRPILECVVRNSGTSFVAHFGFKNESNQTVSIPVGPANSFSPSPQNRNQPTTFPKGRSPFHPNAAFSVPFNGSNLTWTLRGPDHHSRSVTANSSSPRCQVPPSPTPTPTATPTPLPSPTPPLTCASPVLGARRFTRICDDNGPTVYNQTFALPAGAVGPFTLRVVNGDAQGRNKTTSAEVRINGVEVVRESDFSNNVVTFTRVLPGLAPSNQLYVRVKGAPNSTFTLEICGASQGDATPPAIEWLRPQDGELLKDAAPLYQVRYSDAGSGVDLSTLRILVDGVDQTALFSKTTDEASFDSVAPLPDGAHSLRAEIKDQAGNPAAATRSFRVDATLPSITVVEPAGGSLTRLMRPPIRISLADAGVLPSGIDPASLIVSIDGVDVTAAFTLTGSEATGVPPTPLADGSRRIDASIADRAGNRGSVSSLFTIDTLAPMLSLVTPTAGQTLGYSSVPVLVQYSDEHGLNLASFSATLDGAPLSLLGDADSASGTASNLSDGSHTLALSIADQAGNVRTNSTQFMTDTGNPEILIFPASGQAINRLDPEIVVFFSDAQGIAPGTLKITVNRVVRTTEFIQTASEARATLSLPAGPNVVAAEVRDGASNLGTATSSFIIDVTPPSVTVRTPSPGAFVNDPTPDIDIELSDNATGVAGGATVIFVDGVDVTADFSRGATGARGTLTTALSEGEHTLEVTAADGASNSTTVRATFHVDLTPPTLDFASPRVDGFTNDPTPEIWLRLADPAGPLAAAAAGVDLASARVFVLSEDPLQPDTDITLLLTPTADPGLRGEFLTALADGTHRLRATVRDLAGNPATLTVGFVVDTEAPALAIDQPQSKTSLNSAEPTIVLLYSDARSGIADDLVQVRIDGVERAATLVRIPTGATLTLSRSLGLDLADGPHRVEARVVDQAGNAIDAGPVAFGIDTVAPVATVLTPAPQSFVGTKTPSIQFKIEDAAPSAGINTDFAKVLLDGVDISAAITFTTAGTGTTEAIEVTGGGAVPTPLGDGLHTLRITAIDNANNPVEVISQFTVDTAPPVVNPDIPEGGATIGGGAVSPGGTTLITGTLRDLDPGVTVICSAGGVSLTGTVVNGNYSCNLPVNEGTNQVSVTVTDSTGHTTTTTRDVIVDRTAPVVTIDSPTATDATGAQFITVLGHVQDATAVRVAVNGVTATVTRLSSGGPASFVASNVPVGPGPTATFAAIATDAAANTGESAVTIPVDRIAPVVTITRPAAGAYLKPGLVEVEFEVTDRSATLAEVNGVPAFDPTCTGQDGVSRTCRFVVTVPLVGDGLVVASAVDAAGNIGQAQVSAILDSAAPNIVVFAPSPLLVTNATNVRVAGLVTDSSPFTLRVNGQTLTIAPDGAFDATIPAGPDGPRDLVFVATDAAGNEATTAVSIVIDRTAPVLSIVTPVEGAVIPSLPLVVSGTINDATAVTVIVQGLPASVVGQAYTATLSSLTEGPISLTVRAVDSAGNEAVLTRAVEIDLAPPTVAITSPASGTITRLSSITLAYSIQDRSRTSIALNGAGVTPDCPGFAPCERSASVLLQEGDNTFTVEGTDAGGRTASAQVMVTRDGVAPVLDLQAPETVSRGRASVVTASATDNGAMDHIEVRLDSAVICTGVSTCSAAIALPESARAGDALTLTAVASDRAGNTTTRTRSIRVTADGVVTGTVLDDTTSLPLAGASVSLLGAVGRTVITDAQGRYNLPVADTSAVLRIEKTGMTSVDRVVSVVSGVGTVPLDARLTPIAAITTFSPVIPATNPPAVVRTPPDGIPGLPGPVSLAVSAGAHRVTLLSPQGLPNLLPPGFSPLTAFHWTTDGAVDAGAATFAMPIGPATVPDAVLVRYDTSMRDWRILVAGLSAVDGRIAVTLAGPGTYALVVPDAMTPPIVIAAVGDALAGLPALPIPATATSESRVSPGILPPTGGTAMGSLRLDTPSSLPSGTILQADVEESYLLASGEEASAAKRSMDVIAFKRVALSRSWGTGNDAGTIQGASNSSACAPSTPVVPVEGAPPVEHLCAAFPITPSRTYAANLLKEGRVHLDLLAGRENARGVVGGNEATSVVSDSVRLNLAAGSLPEDTAIVLTVSDSFSPFVPNTATVIPLAEVSLDFFGATLHSSASLTFANVAAAAGDTLVLARVDRAGYDGIPRLQVVALGDVWPPSGTDPMNRVVTREAGIPGVALDGITQTGRYILFHLSTTVAFITGVTTAGVGAVRAIVASDSLPFVATSNASGSYAIPVVPGPVTLTARVLGSSLVGGAQMTAANGTVVLADIALQGTVTQATVNPASGANSVLVNEPMTLTSPVALDPASITDANIRLSAVPGAQVALRFVLSGSGKQLSILPYVPPADPPRVPTPPALQFATDYRLEITGLRDTVGGVVTAPVTTFRTQVYTKKVYDLTAITFSLPSAEGLITVSAPNGTLDPGTTVLIINGGNGVVLGLTAGNGGQLQGTLPAGIDDILFVTVTDPFGNATSFQRSEFVDPVTGETAVGAFGGTVRGPAGSSLVIPEQALDKGTKFKLDYVTPDALEQRYPGQQPDFGVDGSGQPISHVGGALKVEVTVGEPKASKELDLLFPIPANLPEGVNPTDAFYYVYQRVEGPCANGASTCADNQREYFLRTLDHAFVECEDGKPSCAAARLRVRTASPPFNGFDGALSFNAFGNFTPVGISMNLLVWTLNQMLPGTPQSGVITGYVLQPVRERKLNGTDQPVLKPVAGARVSGQDAGGQAFTNGSQVEAVTGDDGRFTLFDPRYVGGPFTLSARYTDAVGEDHVTSATGFESNPEDSAAIQIVPVPLRQYRNRALLNLSFPAVEPPPPIPEIEISVCEETAGGCVVRNGLALVGRPLRIRATVATESGATIKDGEVNGTGVNVVSVPSPDPAKQVVELQPGGAVANAGRFTPESPGSYVVRVRALTRELDSRVETLTFRVVGSSGAVDGLPNEAPGVISGRTLPRNGAQNVPVTNLRPEVYFTEPVKNLVAGFTITLAQVGGEGAGPVEFDMIGVGAVNGVPVIVQSVTAASLMTSLTLKPKRGLRLGVTYVLTITSDVVDTDSPAKALPLYTTFFKTFTPRVQGEAEGGFPSPGIGLVDNLAFVVQNNFFNGNVFVWDIGDPAAPKNLTISPLLVAPRPIDVTADPLGEPMAAVSVVSTNTSKPSSVVFVDAQNPADPRMSGAVTVASSAQDGFISRSAFHKGFVYLATTKKGIQMVDVGRGQNIPDLATNFQARTAINTDGQGFGEDAVTTIPYPTATYPNSSTAMLVKMSDIAAADIQGQPLVASTGTLPLLLVDPLLGSVRAYWKPGAMTFTPAGATAPVTIQVGYAIGLGRMGAYDLAVLVALVDEPDPASRVRLIAINVRNPAQPEILGSVDLAPNGGPVDVTLRGTTAIVTTQKNASEGEAIIVELVDPTEPYVKGRLAGAGGRAAINSDGQVVTTAVSPFGGPNSPIGGVRSLVLESACTGLGNLRTKRIVQYRIFDPTSGETVVEDARINLNLCQQSKVTLMVNGAAVPMEVDNLDKGPVAERVLSEGTHSFGVPNDVLPKVTDEREFTVTIKSVIDEEERTITGRIVGEIRNRPMLPVSHTFVKGVDLFDGHLSEGAADLQVKGRHFNLDVSRSYSSAGLGEGKSGWNWNYEGVISRANGIYNVITADGSSQRFTKSAGSFVPQKGYHSKLSVGGDGELVFIDKAANRHVFRAETSDTWVSGPWRLVSVEEPHGDMLKVAYNKYGRVDTVKEFLKGASQASTTLTFFYKPFRTGPVGEPIDPKDVALEKVVAQAANRTLNLTVEYEHVETGELRRVTRRGANIGGGPAAQDEVWEYRYSPPTEPDKNRLERIVDPDGHVTRYEFIEKPSSPSEGDTSGRAEFVNKVVQSPGNGVPDVVTEFTFGERSNGATSSTTTVKDPRGLDTTYTMNGHGGVTQIAEPLGRVTTVEWMTTDALKQRETLPDGIVKQYQYDVNGNQTRERVTGTGGLVAVTIDVYDQKFNKVTSHTDPEQRTTTWEINQGTGDLDSMRNALGDRTTFEYDAVTGLLKSETDPRGAITTYVQDTDLGIWKSRTTTLGSPVPSAITAARTIDARGRVTRATDGIGGEVVREYDGLDRPRTVRRVAKVTPLGGASETQDTAAEVTRIIYTRGGQARATENALGAVTTNTIDGMNRVTATSTPVTGGVPTTITTATEYDGNGNVVRTTDPRGVVRRMNYDDLNRLTTVTIESGLPGMGPTGVIQSFTYKGPTDFKETETDISGNVTTFVYDGLFRMVERQAAEPGYVERFAYDLVGNVLTSTDANRKVTKTLYDGLNRPIRVTRDFGGASEVYTDTKYEESSTSHVFKTEEYDSQKKLRVRYAYDVAGRLRAVARLLEGAGSVEARAVTAANAGDAAANSGALSLFAGGVPAAPVRYVEDYSHEVGTSAGGVATTVLEPSLTVQGTQRSVRVEKDGLGREIVRSRAGLPAVETRYDGLGGKREVKDENGNTTKWDYDTAGRLIGMTDGENKSAAYKVDAAGNRIEETDRRGVMKTFAYDNLNRLVRTDVAGSRSGVPWSEATEYLDSTRQRRVTDARGTVTLTTMDGLGRPRTIKQFGTEDGGGDRMRAITYDGADKQTESDWLGRVTTFGYDGLHRETKVTDPAPFAAQTVETTYDDPNNRTVVKDRRGRHTVTQHDSLGRVVWIHRGECDANGTVSEACETVERNEFDGSGNKVLSADGRERKTRFEYDGASRLVAREEGYEAAVAADTTVIRFTLDNGGRVTKEFHGRLAASEPAMTRGWDKVNRVVSEKNGEGEETIYEYDGEGNRTSVKPPGRPATGYGYDEFGKLTSVTMPPTEDYATGAITRFTYDENRNKKTQTDARANTAVYEYDRANRLISTLEPDNLSTSVKYDANGNALELTDPNVQKSTSTYDELNRKKTTEYAAGPTTQAAWRQVTRETFEYDENGNPLESHRWVASGTDPPQDRSIIRTFDALDRQLTETSTLPDGGTKQVSYEYYPNGTRKSVIDPNIRRTAYEYDAQNRVKTMVTNAAPDSLTSSEGVLGTTTYSYYPDDLVKEVTEPNQVKATSTYDKAGRLLTLTNSDAFATKSSYAYEYDPQGTGNRTKQIETNNSAPGAPAGGIRSPETTLYAYDAANRLKKVTYPQDATYPAGRVIAYTYDKAGNREGEKESVPATAPQNAGAIIVERAGTFDVNNRLRNLAVLSVTDNLAIYNPAADGPGGDPNSPSVTPAKAGAHSSLSLVYDKNGNETSRSATPFGGGTTVITESTYDLTDHLVEQTRDAAIITRHEYDAEGRRTKKIGEDGIRQFLYDDTSLLAEYDTNGLEVAKYAYGGDRLIRLTRSDEGTRYFSFDGLGSVTNLTTNLGEVSASYHLDAWGNYRFTSELAPSRNRFGFTGHYWDNEAGLYYAKARYYDPFTARFTQSDSFLGSIDNPPSLHRYTYANDNPTMFVDLSGHAGSDNQARHFGTYRGGPSDTAKAFAGVFYGFGQTIEAGGQLSYDFTGTLLYGRGEVLHEETAKRFFGMVDHANEVGLFNSVIEGLTQPFKNFQSAMDRGDAFGAATAVGNVTGQALTVGEGVANLPKITLTVSGPGLGPEFAYAMESVATASGVLPKVGIRFGGGSGNLAGLSGISLMSEASQGSRGDTNADSSGSSRRPLGDETPSAEARTRPVWLGDAERGIAFNKARQFDYPARELYLDKPGGGYVRLDAYDTVGEIISRKLTQLSKVQESTGIGYLRELATKYPPGARVANVPSSGPLAGQFIRGQQILEVPVQIRPIPAAVLSEARRLNIVIRDVTGNVYR